MKDNQEEIKQVKSKERVKDFGEVFTNPREVKAMLDLVKDESYRIESTFLEPACGNGNFLIEIIDRKLKTVSSVAKDEKEWILLALVAVGSVYGIDIQEDNVDESKERMFLRICEAYEENYEDKVISKEDRKSIKHVLDMNIIHGDGLTGLQHGKNADKEIMFSSWNFSKYSKESLVTRKDYSMNGMIAHNKKQKLDKEINSSAGSLFSLVQKEHKEEEQKPNFVTEYIPYK